MPIRRAVRLYFASIFASLIALQTICKAEIIYYDNFNDFTLNTSVFRTVDFSETPDSSTISTVTNGNVLPSYSEWVVGGTIFRPGRVNSNRPGISFLNDYSPATQTSFMNSYGFDSSAGNLLFPSLDGEVSIDFSNESFEVFGVGGIYANSAANSVSQFLSIRYTNGTNETANLTALNGGVAMVYSDYFGIQSTDKAISSVQFTQFGNAPVLDNFSIATTAVPEPSALGLLFLAIGFTAKRKWRRLLFPGQ